MSGIFCHKIPLDIQETDGTDACAEGIWVAGGQSMREFTLHNQTLNFDLKCYSLILLTTGKYKFISNITFQREERGWRYKEVEDG